MSDFSHNGHGHSNDGHEGAEQPLHIRRLVKLMVREAWAGRFNGITIDAQADRCPVFFVRGDEAMERDALPTMLFNPLKEHIAEICGMKEPAAQGTFTASLRPTETKSSTHYDEVRVSVDFGEGRLRLKIEPYVS